MSSALQVAAIQLTSGAEVSANLATAGRLLARAAGEGAAVAVLPENFSVMARRDVDRRALAEVDGSGPVQDFLAHTAAADRLALRRWRIAT